MAERLATLEAGYRRLSERCDEMLDILQGDGSDEGWKRSIRGRIHTILADLATADKLAYAADQMKQAAQAQAVAAERAREREHERGRKRVDTWLQVVAAICAVTVATVAVAGFLIALLA